MATQYKVLVGDTDTSKIRVPTTGDHSYLMPVTLDAATGNESAVDIQYTVNKATSGNDTGLLVNQTDTASPGTSYLADFQVGGTSQLQIDNAGQITCDPGGSFGNTTGIAFGDGDTVIYETSDDLLSIDAGGVTAFQILSTHVASQVDLEMATSKKLGWYSAAHWTLGSGSEVALTWNSQNTQTSGNWVAYSVSRTYNQASGTAANTDLLINRTETAVGSGAQLLADFQVGGTSQWKVDNSGNQTFGGAATIDTASGDLSISAAGVGALVLDDDSNHTLASTLDAATGNEVALSLNYTTNKATSGNDTGLLINQTDTASPGISFLADFQVGGTSKISIRNDGTLQFGNDTYLFHDDESQLGLADLYSTNNHSIAIYGAWNDASNKERLHIGHDGIYGFIRVEGFGSELPHAPLRLQNITDTRTSGAYSAVLINPTYNQTSGTAANTDLLVNRTETAVGSGAQLLADFQVGGASRLRVSTGNTTQLLQFTNDAELSLGAFADRLVLNTKVGMSFYYASATTETDVFLFGQLSEADELTASSGTQNYLSAKPEINQTSTAGYTGILLDVTETATGSGAKNLLDLQVGSVSKFSVDNAGLVDIAAGGSLHLDKTTDDAAFINFQATADADATSAISTLTTSGAVTHHIQISINGTTAWIPCSTTDPT